MPRRAANYHESPEQSSSAGRRRRLSAPLLLLLTVLSLSGAARAQAGGHTLYGDFKVDESKVQGMKPISFDLILHTESGTVVARQVVSSPGRFRFLGLGNGRYDIVVEVENKEVARIRVDVNAPVKTDFRQDIELEWRPEVEGKSTSKPSAISAADFYKRPSASQKRFDKARDETNKKRYDEATSLLKQIVGEDANDFQAWTELGTLYLFQQNLEEAEKAYERAQEVRPNFFLARLNLGRLRLMRKKYDGAVEALSKAVELQPQSADANYYLGEAYLQVKKGSKAVGHLYEALRIDPVGKAEAHLRLAALYNAAGMKDKAAEEYEQFLAKKPDHPEKAKLQKYIAENKKK
jgi:Tfp pilus assembly protein PilF